jgi:hypothetical protein
MRCPTSGTLQRLRTTLLLTASVMVGACADDVLAPGDQLIGRWGGGNTELVANAEKVVIRLICSRVDIQGPLTIGSGRNFDGVGLLSSGSLGRVEGTVRIEGHLLPGDGLRLTLVLNDDVWLVQALRKNRPPEPAGIVCL